MKVFSFLVSLVVLSEISFGAQDFSRPMLVVDQKNNRTFKVFADQEISGLYYWIPPAFSSVHCHESDGLKTVSKAQAEINVCWSYSESTYDHLVNAMVNHDPEFWHVVIPQPDNAKVQWPGFENLLDGTFMNHVQPDLSGKNISKFLIPQSYIEEFYSKIGPPGPGIDGHVDLEYVDAEGGSHRQRVPIELRN